MPEASNTSFIPKQNPAKIKRSSTTRQVYFLTLVSYLLIIAALVAAAAIFFYERYSKVTLNNEIKGLSEDIDKFNQANMDTVTELDERLIATKKVLDNTISMPAVLSILELNTIESVQFLNTTITRGDDNTIKLEAAVKTDSFDSVLFQRQIYDKAATLSGVELTDVTIALAGAAKEGEGKASSATVSLSAVFTVPAGEVAFSTGTTTVPVKIDINATTTTTPIALPTISPSPSSSPAAIPVPASAAAPLPSPASMPTTTTKPSTSTAPPVVPPSGMPGGI